MFFVNGRPCGLPQFAKAFNEVYKSYNNSQTPFILADIQLDTHMYDVNVSPDKRSILLHDQNQLLDNLRMSLTNLFDSQDYSVPTSQLLAFKSRTENQPSGNTPFKPLPITPVKPRSGSNRGLESDEETNSEDTPTSKIPSGAARKIKGSRSLSKDTSGQNLISGWIERRTTSRSGNPGSSVTPAARAAAPSDSAQNSITREESSLFVRSPSPPSESDENDADKPLPVRDFNKQLKAKTVTKDIPFAAANSPPTLVQTEPQIPATQPLRRGQESGHANELRTPRRQMKPDITTVFIGDEMVQGAAGASDDDEEMTTTLEDNMSTAVPKHSFGSRLTQIYAAGARAVKENKRSHPGSSEEDSDVSTSSESGDGDAGNDDAVSDAVDARDVVREKAVSLSENDKMEERGVSSVSPDSPAVSGFSEAVTFDQKSQPLKSSVRKKESTAQLLQHLRTDESLVRLGMASWANGLSSIQDSLAEDEVTDLDASNAEEKLSLTIARKDFLRMRIAGQFNMGFIIASRPANKRPDEELEPAENDELFIIDQHATDEKYNFERLQEIQTVQSQRLVHPKRLELTALEEEIVLQNLPAIEANGFKVHVDMSGDEPVGSRCEVLALPMSREVTFSLTDFDELIALLGEESSESKHIPRPSKVRKMFASRACRSSVMIGKALTHGQMETLVRHMAELDKPWNCPHGRPTMRHLCRLDSWDAKGWRDDGVQSPSVSWQSYMCDK
jgi:DNA mismatch repair protein PMS2